jgi:hypothetical protein
MTYRRTFDNDYEFLAPNGFISHCHLQIYRAEGRPMLVVASELPPIPACQLPTLLKHSPPMYFERSEDVWKV